MRLLLAILFCGAVSCRGSDEPKPSVGSGNVDRGRTLIAASGCGSCHMIPGVVRARGLVGPPLGGIADRAYIAGVLPNTEGDMIRWLRDPPAVAPRTLMPNMRLTERDARDIAAYLYQLSADPLAVRMVRGFIERATGRQLPSRRGPESGGSD